MPNEQTPGASATPPGVLDPAEMISFYANNIDPVLATLKNTKFPVEVTVGVLRQVSRIETLTIPDMRWTMMLSALNFVLLLN